MDAIQPMMGSHPGVLNATLDDAERYEIVRRRDAAFNGAFYYGVSSTGIYCRPNCAARLAHRENVTFYTDCAAAERAGFRPCKRCRPDKADPAERHAEAVRKACDLIEHAEEMPNLSDLAAASSLSTYHFHRVFKRITGVTPKAYASAHRSRRVADSLRDGGTVTRAIAEAGFNAPSRFYEHSTARLGMTPTAYRKGGAGATIRFAVGKCSLGSILVAATERGICAIEFGDKAERLLQDLQYRFPNAKLQGRNREFEKTMAEVIGFIDASDHPLNLPLDIRGTAFQEKVWQALRRIPYGKTASYTDIAEAIGQPTAVRAVARACGANKLAVAIPCHRVVRVNGDLSGYRWGIKRKKALLARETRQKPGTPSDYDI